MAWRRGLPELLECPDLGEAGMGAAAAWETPRRPE
jgi:hypothetical protein